MGFVKPEGCRAYLAGMSLGLASTESIMIVNEELGVWASQGVLGHHRHPHGRAWAGDFEQHCHALLSPLLGSFDKSSIQVMGDLSTNLHLLLHQLYPPCSNRAHVLMDPYPFPSDLLIAESHVQDIDRILYPECDADGVVSEGGFERVMGGRDDIAVVFMSAVHYLTGQVYDIEGITAVAHAKGIPVILDLAHAIGNIPLLLDSWNVDAAAWCSYKYLNGGPGAISGLYLHPRHHSMKARWRGWWGMQHRTPSYNIIGELEMREGAGCLAMGNPSVLSMAGLLGGLRGFAANDIHMVYQRSQHLVGLFRERMSDLISCGKLRIITPSPGGAMLSLVFPGSAEEVYRLLLAKYKIICDLRNDRVIRVAFTGLYNDEGDVHLLSTALNVLLND